MVAKSFQSMTQICEPYKVNGKMYVKVRNEKTGTERQVRWYTDFEYAKMYPETESPIKHFRTQKYTLGFDEGYITIFKGDTYAHLEWFQESIARYTRIWGWYVRSVDPIPVDLPAGLELIRLPWELVGTEDEILKPEAEAVRAVEALIYDEGSSTYQGSIGERLDLHLTVIQAVQGNSQYGTYTTHVFEDANGNQYVWQTSAKSWAVGDKKHIKGTVKDHKIFRNTKQTILTRCSEIK